MEKGRSYYLPFLFLIVIFYLLHSPQFISSQKKHFATNRGATEINLNIHLKHYLTNRQ